MFGCYRRTEAADPEIYVTAVAFVLSKYPREIIEAVTDPYAGLPSRKNEKGYSGLPDVADVKEACEAEAVRRARLAELAALPKPDFNRRRLRPPPAGPGAWATILVGMDTPQWPRMVELAKSGKTDPREWRWDAEEGGAIWVAWSWLDGPAKAAKRFVPFTDDQLRALYPVKKPVDTEEEGVPF